MDKPRLKPEQLRTSSPWPEAVKNLKRNKIYFILDDVMDTYNIGTIFRLADAVNAEKVFLGGITEAPPNIKVKRASVNTWQWVKWEKKISAQKAIDDLREDVAGIKIIGLEQDEKSISYDKAKYDLPVALVVGHETHGIHRDVLKKCDSIVELPLLGVNSSLNVIVSLAIVAYKVLEENGLS
ncbi:hypothetical protein HYZ76_00350 [Candidatus Falkowbacteria bacterium]|nr:hypothetical protein [Candidatus Falkowbacteria bacterium]